MKLKKKTAMILSFAVGTTMFATTAMAEVVSKNGYDQIKDSAKYTAEACTSKLSNYTADMSFVMKDNGTVIYSNSNVNKYDVSKQAMEDITSDTKNGAKTESYYYSDKNGQINKRSDENIYHTIEYTAPKKELTSFKNPFKEKQAGDLERIADALIGNLKDSVVVTQNPDGSKQLSGSLNESQIPALVNAVVSFQSRNIFDDHNVKQNNMPKITKDIFVKEVKGTMIVSKDGLIQSVLGTGVLSGKDANGKDHTMTFELLGKLSNINSTVVKKPDLSGKKVEKSVEKDSSALSNPEKYVGKYKTDILIEKDGKFQKIGEKLLDIESINAKSVSGKYHEEFLKGFEDYATDKKEFKFNGEIEEKRLGGKFTAATSDNKSISGNIDFSSNSASIYFNIDGSHNRSALNTNNFNRVFN